MLKLSNVCFCKSSFKDFSSKLAAITDGQKSLKSNPLNNFFHALHLPEIT